LEIKVYSANEEAQHVIMRGPGFFFWREKGLFVFSHVLNVPLSYFHGVPQVPKLFHKTFLICSSIYPIWFTSHVHKQRWQAVLKDICYYFTNKGLKILYSVINVPKKSMMGQSIWLIQKERKSLLHT
jgi:hypothetical protein